MSGGPVRELDMVLRRARRLLLRRALVGVAVVAVAATGLAFAGDAARSAIHPPDPPPAPLNLSAAYDDEIVLRWAAPHAVDSFTVRKGATTIARDIERTTHTDPDVRPGGSYRYEVVSVAADGRESVPAVVVVVVPEGHEPVVLAPVEGVQAAAERAPANAASVVVSWKSSDDPRIVEYVVYRDGVAQRPSVPARQTTYRDRAVSSGGMYVYDVEARDAEGRTSSRSTPARVTVEAPRDTVRPTAPPGLGITAHTASAGRTTRTFVRATWERATDNVGVTAYRVFRDGRLLATVEEASGLAFAEDVTGLDTSQEHVYTVRAVDAAGNESAPSNEDSYPARVD